MTLNLDRSSWTRVKFGDVVNNVNENVKDANGAGITRVVGLEHLDPGELKVQRWASTDDETTFSRRVRPGQTLFGKRRSYQRKTAYAEFDAICSGDILVFAPKNTTVLLPELLPFIASTDAFYAMALETSAGSLSPRTRWSDIAKYEFNLPPLDEQMRIAHLLWAVEHHAAALAKLEDLTTLVARSRVDAMLSAEPLKALAELSSSIVDCEHKTAPTTSGRVFGKVIGTPDIRGGKIVLETARAVDAATYASWTRRAQPQAGDLIFAREAPVGEIAVVSDGEKVCLGQRTVLIRPKEGIDPVLIHCIIRSSMVQAHIKARSVGSTVPHLNVQDVRDLKIPWPANATAAARMSEWVSAGEAAVRRLRDELDSVRAIRAALFAAFWPADCS